MKKLLLLSVVLLATLIFAACAPAAPGSTTGPAPTEAMSNEPQLEFTGKKIVYVNAYHEGYAWSDGIEAGLNEIFDGTGIELKIIRLDTKNNPEEAFGKEAGLSAWQEIQAFSPDVVIASDDNSQKYVIVPYMKDSQIPVVFNGVNWDGSAYGYPFPNMTGMIEVELPDQLIELLTAYAEGKRLGYITIDTETERKVIDTYNQRFFDGQMTPYFVRTQDEFKSTFISAQEEVDILMIGNNAGSDVWDETAMQQFFLENTTIPTGSINDWMAPYSLLTLAKSAQEQGEWAAEAAIAILRGTSPSEIPIAENKQGQLILNLEIAEKLNIVFSPSLLKNAVILGE